MNLDLKPHVAAVAESMKQVVANIDGKPITRGDLAAAFDLVSNKQNWKAPIDARLWLSAWDEKLVKEAVRSFAGCEAEFTPLRRNADPSGKRRWRVTAVGYYQAVGA